MSVNSINQYTQVNSQALSYDSNGNLTDDGERTLSYDPANRLATASYAGSNSSYQFDAFNRRIAKTVDGQKTWFIHDGDEVIAEYSNTGSLEAEYIAGVGLDEWLVIDNGSGRHYYAEDGLGSTRYLTDTAGNLAEQYQYDPYGNVSIFDAAGTQRLASDANNPYLFTGRRLDEETGLYHYRNRGYHPELGRFLQRDPLGYIDSLNAFSYVVNNPVNWVDPMGLLTLAPPGPWYANPWFWVVTLGGWAAYEAGQAWNRNPPSWPDWFPRTETDTSGGRNFCPVQNQKADGDAEDEQKTDKTPASPDIPRPKDFDNPNVPPGPDWKWKGRGEPETGKGNWYNEKTGESLHPDINHLPPKGRHWGYHGPEGDYDIYPDGRVEPN